MCSKERYELRECFTTVDLEVDIARCFFKIQDSWMCFHAKDLTRNLAEN